MIAAPGPCSPLRGSPVWGRLKKDEKMLKYLLVSGAIVAEVIATSALKASDGFSKLWPSVITVICYAAAFYLLSIAMRYMQMGIIYAIWSGVGIVLISLVGLFLFGQKPDLPAVIGLTLIIAGVLVINLFSRTAAH